MKAKIGGSFSVCIYYDPETPWYAPYIHTLQYKLIEIQADSLVAIHHSKIIVGNTFR